MSTLCKSEDKVSEAGAFRFWRMLRVRGALGGTGVWRPADTGFVDGAADGDSLRGSEDSALPINTEA